jgi:hypothetical protein
MAYLNQVTQPTPTTTLCGTQAVQPFLNIVVPVNSIDNMGMSKAETNQVPWQVQVTLW